MLSLPEPLQDAVVRSAVLRGAARTSALHPRLYTPDHVRVPDSGAVSSLLAHLPPALHACVVRACVRTGTELYLPLAGLTAAAIASVAQCLPLRQIVLSAAFPELQGGAPPPPRNMRSERAYDMSPIIARLPGITRLTLHGAGLPAQASPSSTFQLRQLLCLDLSYSSGRAAELVLALPMPHLRTLSLSHLQGEWPTLAADVARLTSLRVLSLASARLSLDTRVAVADILPQLSRLRSLNLSHWRLPCHIAQRMSQFWPQLPSLEHLVMVSIYQDPVRSPQVNESAEAGAPLCNLYLCKRLRDLDVSGIPLETQRLFPIRNNPPAQLTAMHLAQKQVLGAPPMVAALLKAEVVEQISSLARLNVSGFAACTEAALIIAGAASETLTHLELSSPLNKLHAAPPDFAQLGVLCGLRALRMNSVDWHAQGVPAAAVADTLAAMPQLRELLITVPADALRRASWLQEALAGVAADLEILRLSGPLLAQPGAPPAHAHTSVQGLAVCALGNAVQDTEAHGTAAGYATEGSAHSSDDMQHSASVGPGSGTSSSLIWAAASGGSGGDELAAGAAVSPTAGVDSVREQPPPAHNPLAGTLISVGVPCFAALRLLAISDKPSQGLATAAGLASRVRIVHHSAIESTVQDVHGAVPCWDERTDDVMAMHARYAA